MSSQKINIRTIILVLMIIAAAAMRLITYKLSLTYPMEMSNFTPFGAIALFGGAYFTNKWKALLVVFVALFLSNIPINYFYTSKINLFSTNQITMYIVFGVAVLIGVFIKKVSFINVGFASLASVLFHWLFSDLPWFYGTAYAHNLVGYGQSLVAAIPFERNMICADILFGFILFGGFELAKRKYTFLRSNKELAV